MSESSMPAQVGSTDGLGPIDRQTIDCWRVNYILDKTPHELHALWHTWAPPGAVLALKAAIGEIERLRDTLAYAEAALADIGDATANLATIWRGAKREPPRRSRACARFLGLTWELSWRQRRHPNNRSATAVNAVGAQLERRVRPRGSKARHTWTDYQLSTPAAMPPSRAIRPARAMTSRARSAARLRSTPA